MLWDSAVDRPRDLDNAPISSVGTNLLGLLIELKNVMDVTHSFPEASSELRRIQWKQRFHKEIASSAHIELLELIEGKGGIGNATVFQNRLNELIDAVDFLCGNRIKLTRRLTRLSEHREYRTPYTSLRLLIVQLKSVVSIQPLDDQNCAEGHTLSDLTISDARELLGKTLVERFNLETMTNLKLQEKANQIIEELGLPISAYASDKGTGVADLYKRSYKQMRGVPLALDRRGKGKSK
jgi:hypothetical protein